MFWHATSHLPHDSPLGGVAGPTDLVTSEVTHYSFRATWTAPEGPVEKYRVEYMTVAGTQAQQVASVGPLSFFQRRANTVIFHFHICCAWPTWAKAIILNH